MHNILLANVCNDASLHTKLSQGSNCTQISTMCPQAREEVARGGQNLSLFSEDDEILASNALRKRFLLFGEKNKENLAKVREGIARGIHAVDSHRRAAAVIWERAHWGWE